MELTLTLDQGGPKSLQAQIFEQVRLLILDGRLRAGMALPPSRLLAERLAVSRNTVLIAYDRLTAEGYVEPRGTAGVFVSPILPDALIPIGGARTGAPTPHATGAPVPRRPGGVAGDGERPAFDFRVGRADANSFPIRAWRRNLNRLLADGGLRLTDYCDPAGLPDLRRAVADHLGRARGMTVRDDQIIVTAGGQDALNLVVALLRARTRQLCIESPCHHGASTLFASAGPPVHPVPVDEDGIQTERLPILPGSLLYVTPSHQFPTGAAMSLPRRLALLRWAEETDSFIVEDDHDSDFRYDGPPLTSLAGLDRGRRVIYVGSFSRSVGAGLRIGFAAVPPTMWEEARLLKARMSNGQSWLEQAALAAFINDGGFDRHLRKMRQVYRSRRDALVAALREQFDRPTISGAESGLHLVWKLPPGAPTAREVQARARESGIGVYALAGGAVFDCAAAARDDTLVLGYSSLDERQIAAGVARLAALLADSVG